MSVDSPTTYPEHVAKTTNEGLKALAKEQEKEVSPFGQMLIDGLRLKEVLPDPLYKVVDYVATHQIAASDNIQKTLMSVVNRATDLVVDGSTKQEVTYRDNEVGLALRIDAAIASILKQRSKIDDDTFDKRIASAGYSKEEGILFHNSQIAYPTIPDIMLWGRYQTYPDDPKEVLKARFNVNEDDYILWEWQTFQRLTIEQSQSLYKRGKFTLDDFNKEIGRIGWQPVDKDRLKDLAYILPNAMLQVQGGLFQGLDNAKILANISKADIHPDYAQTYMDAVLTKPASRDIIEYQLRQDPTLTNLPNELKKVGIHPDYLELYKTLAYPIPPVADMITMAVREAFTPDVAAKFGQYEDFPKEFEKYAAMRGLSSEWAERYWAAHWNLPSPTQGFEMLHRGVINRDELNMLLRAQDVMPFWRDKLVAIAFRPLTRVDVRRMYKLGVLNEGEVYEAYLDAGYSDENARRMAEFTVKQTLATQSKFTSTDIVKAFVGRMISKSDAVSLLAMIDISYENASRIIETAEYKREWAFKDQQIKGIKNLYKKKIYNASTTQGKLSGLNLPSDQIEILMQQWYYEIKDEPTPTWTTAQTLGFIKKELITPERGRLELFRIGYDDEHINVYMESIK